MYGRPQEIFGSFKAQERGGTELEDRDVFVDGGQVILSFDPVDTFALKLAKLPPSMMDVALKMQPNYM